MTMMDWEKLNAYVDRELDAVDAAGVAAAIARDPALAARVATIARLKAGAGAIEAPIDFPVMPTRTGGRARPGPKWRPIAIAASIAGLIAIAGAGFLSRASDPIDAVAATAAAERDWLSGGPAETPASGVQVAVETGASDRLPDLSPADLRLAYLAADPKSNGRSGLFAGYVGPHGCRLGLWIGRAPSDGAAPSAREFGDVMVRTWSSDGAAYALMSRGMDATRLDRFALVIAEIVRSDHRMTDDLRLALKDASHAGEACMG